MRNRYQYGLAAVPPTPAPIRTSGASGSGARSGTAAGGYGAPPKAAITASYSSAAVKKAAAEALEAEKERQAKLRADADARALAYAKAEELKSMIKSFAKVDDEGRRSNLLDNLCTDEGFDVLALPVMENPPGPATGELFTELMHHQKQGLKWCLEHEYPELPTAVGQKAVQVYNSLT